MNGSNALNALAILQQQYGSANWSAYVPQDWVYYDFIGLPPAGTNQLVFFTNPPGTVDPVTGQAKTYEETDIEKAGSIGNVFFILTKIRTKVILRPKVRQTAGVAGGTTFAADQWTYVQTLGQLLRNGVLSFTIQQKKYWDRALPFQAAPAGFGLGQVLPPAISVNGGAATATGINAFLDQSHNDDDGYDQFPVQVMAPETTFDLRITFPLSNSPSFASIFNVGSSAQPAAVLIGVLLEGIMVRPQQ